ncbi:hypothetical protein [Culicoidibacter larvae]|nr:hypothetical protein [Culicoidibacter larvae]
MNRTGIRDEELECDNCLSVASIKIEIGNGTELHLCSSCANELREELE